LGLDKGVELEGRVVSAGVALGRALIVDDTSSFPRHTIGEDEIPGEQDRLACAIEAVRRSLRHHIEAEHGADSGEVQQVLNAHQMVLGDEGLLEAITHRIGQERKNAEWAVAEVSREIIRRFEEHRDPYLRARAEDHRDMGNTLIEALIAERSGSTCALGDVEHPVVVARHFFPSTALRARRIGAVAFLAESHATVSHAAIILKGLGIPVLGAVDGLLEEVRQGDLLVVDAMRQRVIVRPDSETRTRYERVVQETSTLYDRLAEMKSSTPIETRTSNGSAVRLYANIENPRQLPVVRQSRLEGIGLFRTEFLALDQGFVPGEEAQVKVYTEVLRAMGSLPVVIRTLDIGADKDAGLARCTGENPALGVRGIRRHLRREPGELRTQLRAILRAGNEGNPRILPPMVTRVEDIREAREHLERAKKDLQGERIPIGAEIPLGAMIEIPAAAVSVREILQEVDYVSIGTNDLIQYLMAADRDNPDVLTYQDTRHPAFLWMLQFIADEARAMGRMNDVGICGEIASDPTLIPVLVRMGYRSLSISPALAEGARKAISHAPAESGGPA